MWWKSWKKPENALLEKNFKVIFSTFFLLKLSQSNPILGFYKKSQKMFTTYLQNKIKKRVFTKNLLRCFKTFKTKKVLKIFNFFLLYSVPDAPCDSRRKFHADRRIFKHCQKSAKMSVTIVTRCRQRVNL
jgi:hypothetical protein